jgi:hypothetical protein
MWRVPGNLLVQPDQQRPTLAERSVVGGPVIRAVERGLGLAHAARPSAWIPDVNPSRQEFRNNAELVARFAILKKRNFCKSFKH